MSDWYRERVAKAEARARADGFEGEFGEDGLAAMDIENNEGEFAIALGNIRRAQAERVVVLTSGAVRNSKPGG